MKFKKLTVEQVILSLDRLTRFKHPKEKYLRVYSDIISSCLLDTKLKKEDILNADYSELAKLASEIVNNSLPACDTKFNIINDIVLEFEKSVFKIDTETENLIKTGIDFFTAANFIPQNSPVNLIWLKTVCENSKNLSKGNYKDKLISLRMKNGLKYPLEKVLLVEGITEEILLPVFAKFMGYDFNKFGVHIIASGGKNQVVKTYYKLCEELNLPVFILLDKDAEDNILQIKPKLRGSDKVHLVSCGEFEDLLPHTLIIKTINNYFKNFLTINDSDISAGLPMAKILTELYRTKGFHEFKKAEFAKLVSQNISEISDLSEEIKTVINEIKQP